MQAISLRKALARPGAKVQTTRWIVILITLCFIYHYWMTENLMRSYFHEHGCSENVANIANNIEGTLWIQRDGRGYSCCARFTEQQMNRFEELWRTHSEHAGIHFKLLYRGVEVDIGGVAREQIKAQADRGAGDVVLCTPVPADIDHLLTTDASYKDFLENMDRNIRSYEKRMVQAASKVKVRGVND